MNPVIIAAFTWSITALVVLILVVERSRQKRLFSRVRGFLDRALDNALGATENRVPQINSEFSRQFLHYSIHIALSSMLRAVRRLEDWLRQVVRINRQKAIERRERREESYLSKIVAHKEVVALSDEEKVRRKDAALRGEF